MSEQRNCLWTPLGLLATLALTVAPANAQTPTTDLRIQELVRRAAQQLESNQVQSGSSNPQGTAASLAFQDNRPTVSLTLDEVVRLAVDRNLNIASQRLNPAQFDPAIAALRAAYWPQATSLSPLMPECRPFRTSNSQLLAQNATRIFECLTSAWPCSASRAQNLY